MPPAADEIRALAITLNGMLDRLAAARERQRSFVADAAHELRSPLASMRAQLEVAEQLGEGGTLPADLLVDLSRLSGAGRGPAVAGPGPTPTPGRRRGPSWIDGAVAAHRGGGRLRRASGCRSPSQPGQPVLVMADAEELRRALANLVDNAVRHATHRVELAAELDADEVVLIGAATTVRESPSRTGSGSSSGSPGSTTPGPGTPGGSGLGLAIVRELVRRAGGDGGR